MSESKLSPSLGLASHSFVLHLWPRHDDLLSFDPSSVAALLYLQLTLPGQFALAYCANPDLSPSGKLHNARNVDADLNPVQTAQLTARIAHVESNYGDLIRYYVPARIRSSHKARLEAVELWDVPEVEEEPEEQRRVVFGKRKRPRPQPDAHHFKRTFEREKVVEKAKALFEVYDRLLGDHSYFMGSQSPTTLDVVFAAHTHMLLNLRLPDLLVASALESYPRLVTHCRTVISAASPPHAPAPPTIQHGWLSSLRSLFPWPRSRPAHSAASALANSPEVQSIERRYRLWRWGFIAGSVLATTGYLFLAVTTFIAQNPEVVAQIRAAAEGGIEGAVVEASDDDGDDVDEE
ncbi:hypothetical protein C8Q79DRAFT_1009181 [Trametes meyenii]|nr:hypothetical protein C8Q79DRAFT_1009181 [Trametes meyenii]